MKKKSKLILLCAGAIIVSFAMSCGKEKPKDVKGALENMKKVYSGLFEILEENVSSPKEGIERAETYVEEKRSEMAKYGEMLRKTLTAEEMFYVDTFNRDMDAMSIKTSEKIRKSYSKLPDAKDAIIRMMRKLKYFHDVDIDREQIRSYIDEVRREKSKDKK